MRSLTRYCSLLVGAICVIFYWSVVFVNANLFTRLVNFKRDPLDPDSDESEEEEGGEKAPFGARNAVMASGEARLLGSPIVFENGMPWVQLSNNNKMPLIGLGVGNMARDLIPSMVEEAIQDDKKTRLFDTTRVSNNEALIAQGIQDGAKRLAEHRRKGGNDGGGDSDDDEDRVEIQVITKVWYTHLGYARTKHSLEASLEELRPALEDDLVDVKVHVLLHWPKCYDNIPWMDCEGEEQSLSQEIKKLGPDPAEDPDTAWQQSWKALEDVYLSDEYPIVSIGVSNFHLHDIESMDSFARIRPHVLQVSLWSLINDAMLIEYAQRHKIHVQVYNALSSTVGGGRNSNNNNNNNPERLYPRAYRHILKIQNELSAALGFEVTPGQVVLTWLVQHGVSVIPKTTQLSRLQENSAAALTAFPALTDVQVDTVAHAVTAYQTGKDVKEDLYVSVKFHAVTKDMMLYWIGHDGEDIRIALIRKGDTFDETTFPNHKFRTYLASNKDVYIDHEIRANFGEEHHIHVEL